MQYSYAFWKPRPGLMLLPSSIYQELQFGEDVEGLIDLPIQELIADMKAAFPDNDEKPGYLLARGATGDFNATWTWQFVGIKAQDLVPVDVDRLCDVFRAKGCGVFEVEKSAWQPPQ